MRGFTTGRRRATPLLAFAIVLVASGRAAGAREPCADLQEPRATAAKPREERPDRRPTVERVRLVGVKQLDEGAIKDVLETRASSWLPWADPRYLDREALRLDLRRIVAYYADHGYPDARVVSHDVALDPQGTEATVTIRIEEGDPVLVKAIELTGFDALGERRLGWLRGRIPVRVGEPPVYREVIEGGELAARALKNRGYPYAEVRAFEDREGAEVVVRYTAEPGPIAYFGPIEITGNASVDDEVIRRKLTFKPGEPYSFDAVQESQQRLFGLNLFRFANIETRGEGKRASEVPTRVTVAEGRHRQVRFSAGYGTEEKARAEARWRHVNFYGGARTLELHGRWSSLNRGAQVNFGQPSFFHPRLSLALDAHSWHSNEPAFTVITRGGSVGLDGFVNTRTTWSTTISSEHQSSRIAAIALEDPSFHDDLIALGLNPVTGEQSGLLVVVGARLQRSTTRNPLDPRRGYQVSALIEQAGGWLPGSYNFVNGLVEGRHYQPFGRRLVVASRLRAGAIDPMGPPSNVPFFKRYFLGGSTSLRGWGRFEVGPLSPAGLPVGGNSMLEGTIELRGRVRGNFGAVAFVDAGNVWQDAWRFRLNDLLVDAGAGLRYYTPVGPVRLDWAWQATPVEGLFIDGRPQERRWRIHFSIGQAF